MLRNHHWIFLFLLYLFPADNAFAAPKKVDPSHLKVLTYNVWMLDLPFKLASRDIEARSEVIPTELAKTNADVIALQEVWSEKYKNQLIAGFQKAGYPYFYHEDLKSSFWLRGWLGNGLLFISKYPLEIPEKLEDRVLGFAQFTRPDEYFARKGALHVRVRIGSHEISLYNTHLGAISFVSKQNRFHDQQEINRLKQSQQLRNFVQKTKGGRPVILVGDFNAHYKTYLDGSYTTQLVRDYQELTCGHTDNHCLNLEDSYRSRTDDESEQYFTASPQFNRYIGMPAFSKDETPARMIDYIFVSRTDRIKISDSRIVLYENMKIPNREEELPLSDHFGVLTSLELF